MRIYFNNRRWDDVEVGQEVTTLQFGPLTYTTMMRAASGTRDSAKHHHDPEYAKANGAPDMFVNTMFYQGLLGRFLTDWGGPESFPRGLRFSMRTHNCPGYVLTVQGEVTKKYKNGEQKLVDIDIHIDNQHTNNSVIASATLELV